MLALLEEDKTCWQTIEREKIATSDYEISARKVKIDNLNGTKLFITVKTSHHEDRRSIIQTYLIGYSDLWHPMALYKCQTEFNVSFSQLLPVITFIGSSLSISLHILPHIGTITDCANNTEINELTSVVAVSVFIIYYIILKRVCKREHWT